MGALHSDGKQIWQTLFCKPETVQIALATRFALEAMACHERKQNSEALNWVNQGLAQDPENLLLMNLQGMLALERMEYETALACFNKLLTTQELQQGARGFLANNIAYVQALMGGAERLAEADKYSQEAMSLIGWLPAVKGTRGTVLLEMGRTDEAIPLLRESMQHAENLNGKAQNACFISIAEARRGNLDASRKYLQEATKLMPDCFLLERANRELQSQAARIAP